jgi:molybdopterin synthase catalytic subunit
MMNEVLKKYLTSLNAHSVEKGSIEEYRNEMVNKVIPEIAEAVKERQRLVKTVASHQTAHFC